MIMNNSYSMRKEKKRVFIFKKKKILKMKTEIRKNKDKEK